MKVIFIEGHDMEIYRGERERVPQPEEVIDLGQNKGSYKVIREIPAFVKHRDFGPDYVFEVRFVPS